MTLGSRIRQLRTEQHMTQTQLAGERITRNMLSQIEHDAASPSMKTLEYLAERLGVSASALLTDAAADTLAPAREALRNGETEECYRLAEQAPRSEERSLLLARAGVELAEAALAAGATGRARTLAARALEQNRHGLYREAELEWRALRLMVRCDFSDGRPAVASAEHFRKSYDQQGWEARYHLILARQHLTQEHLQAAEREIWSITALPPAEKAEYLLLRGKLAILQEKYGNALSFLRQAETLGLGSRADERELFRLLEIACRETEDYKGAYEYAAKAREPEEHA